MNRQIQAEGFIRNWAAHVREIRRIQKRRETQYEEIQRQIALFTSGCLRQAQRSKLPIELRNGKLRLVQEDCDAQARPPQRQQRTVGLREPDMTIEEVMDFIESHPVD